MKLFPYSFAKSIPVTKETLHAIGKYLSYEGLKETEMFVLFAAGMEL